MNLRGALLVQNVLGRFAVFMIGPLYFAVLRLMGYRVRDLRNVRKEFAAHISSHQGPWIICANHLTLVDSFILAYATLSLSRHLTHYRFIPWNLPERLNFQRNIIMTFLCYLAKCVPINRGGNREEMKKTLERCNDLLVANQILLIFPEGGRSRTGRVDTENFSYGVGRFIKDFQNVNVLCIYLRGDHQTTFTNIPKLGDRFTAKMEVFKPQLSEGNGLKAQRHYAEQIVRHLAKMEEEYYSSHRQRHRGFERSAQCREESECAIHKTRIHCR